jgi:N-acetylglucosamine-6-sulfatase
VPPVQAAPQAGGRRLNWRVLTALWLFLAAGLAAGIALRNSTEHEPPRPTPSEASAKPNVVVIMTDDQTAAQMRALPSTRHLIGRTGVDFKSFYVTNPLCCPSRATFLTGQYSHNTGVISNRGPDALPALRESETLGPWLQDAGYRTAFVGKYLDGYGLDEPEEIPPGWTEWHALTDPTTERYYDYEINDNGEIRHYGDSPDDYKTRVLGHIAVDAVRHAARGDRPLFLYVGFNAPHEPSTPAGRDAGTYADVEIPRTPAFNEEDVSDKPSFIRNRPRLGAVAIARIESRNQGALESLTEVDRQVAKIVAAVRDHEELGNTYLVFTSDNGYVDGEHRIEFGKQLAYDPSSRVPLLIRGPGIPNKSNSEALVGNLDLAPTIAAIAGAKPDLEIDGRSLLPYATSPGRLDDRPLLIESPVPDRSTSDGYPYAAIRTDRYLYVDYETGEAELYDLREDPFQLENRVSDPAFEATKRALARRLDQLRDCAGTECDQPIGHIPAPE